jgi:phosphate transport system ATP-binding protein
MSTSPLDANVATTEATPPSVDERATTAATPPRVSTPTAPIKSPVEIESEPGRIDVTNLTAYYGERAAVTDISLTYAPRQVTAMIGPSGCGKSTVLRCLDGLHLTVPGTRVTGDVLLDGESLYGSALDMVEIRQRIGMVFQRPNPFPTMSIADNVLIGLRLGAGQRRRRRKDQSEEIIERSLRHAGLWNEVKDTLDKPGASLSGGQQQRLCIARALAVEPDVLLMDEPCSALDPISTLAIEDTIAQLKHEVTIIIVTHNMQQASRVADYTAFMNVGAVGSGHLVEFGPTADIFSHPTQKETDDYISGRFG